MMYHFMFGLRGSSPLAATPSAAGGCSALTTASFFSSSCMIKLNSGLRVSDLMAPKIAVQKRDAPLDHIIDDEKVDSKNEYRDHHHRSGAAHFLPRRRGDLVHLGAHVVVESLYPLRPGFDLVSETPTGGCD